MKAKRLQMGDATGYSPVNDDARVRVMLDFAQATTDAAAIEILVNAAFSADPHNAHRLERQFAHREVGPGETVFPGLLQHRAQLLSWLPRIEKFDRLSASDSASLLAEVNAFHFPVEIPTGVQRPSLVRLGRSGLEIRERDGLTGMGTVLPFFLPGGVSRQRLARCLYKPCRRWFLRPPIQRGNKAQYCCEAHGNVAKVQAWRKRQPKPARAK
jgi:hypothetical protein